MRHAKQAFTVGMVVLALSLPTIAEENPAGSTNANKTQNIPGGTASGYPAASGKGPGSGHSYQLGTAGPGRGSPNYQGGGDGVPVTPNGNGSGNSSRGSAPPPSADVTSEALTPESSPAPTETLPAVPGPYSRPTGPGYPATSGSAYPYHGGRGRGYGRHQRGYGYGYPGYRGLGGGQYPHHRQYGNPPMYPAPPATGALPADVE